MKRTTYILIGLLIAGLGTILTTVIVISMMGEVRSGSDVSFGGEQQEMSLNGVRAVKIFISQAEVRAPKRILISGEMLITPASESSKESISYPKNEHVKIKQKEDTLLIELDFNAYSIPEKLQHKDYIFADGLNMHLTADSITGFVSNARGLALNFKELKSDSLSMKVGRQEVVLNSCRFRSFDISGRQFNIRANDSEIDNFYLNLDGVRNWKFNNTKTDTQYLSGSGRHTDDLQKGECRRVVWTPLKEDAQLKMNIREKAEIIISPE